MTAGAAWMTRPSRPRWPVPLLPQRSVSHVLADLRSETSQFNRSAGSPTRGYRVSKRSPLGRQADAQVLVASSTSPTNSSMMSSRKRMPVASPLVSTDLATCVPSRRILARASSMSAFRRTETRWRTRLVGTGLV